MRLGPVDRYQCVERRGGDIGVLISKQGPQALPACCQTSLGDGVEGQKTTVGERMIERPDQLILERRFPRRRDLVTAVLTASVVVPVLSVTVPAEVGQHGRRDVNGRIE